MYSHFFFSFSEPRLTRFKVQPKREAPKMPEQVGSAESGQLAAPGDAEQRGQGLIQSAQQTAENALQEADQAGQLQEDTSSVESALMQVPSTLVTSSQQTEGTATRPLDAVLHEFGQSSVLFERLNEAQREVWKKDLESRLLGSFEQYFPGTQIDRVSGTNEFVFRQEDPSKAERMLHFARLHGLVPDDDQQGAGNFTVRIIGYKEGFGYFGPWCKEEGTVEKGSTSPTKPAEAKSRERPERIPKRVNKVLRAAREEMQEEGLPEREIQMRTTILENTAMGRTYFPESEDRPEIRNPEFWQLNAEGYYIPKDRPTDAIEDLWRTDNGMQCFKYSTFIMLKSIIDNADEKEKAKLDDLLRGKVIPNDLDEAVYDVFFAHPEPKNGIAFQEDELLPGDQIWFENPYFDRLSAKQQEKENYKGEQGSNVFYAGNGNVMGIYGGTVKSIEEYREGMLGWNSVQRVPDADPSAFQIKSVRRVIV